MFRFLWVSNVVVWCSLGACAEPPKPQVPAVRDLLQPEVDRSLAEAQKKTFEQLATADKVPALFKNSLRQKAVRDPWSALGDLEKSGRNLAEGSRGGLEKVPALLAAMAKLGDRPEAVKTDLPKLARDARLEQHLDYIESVLKSAAALHADAISKLTEDERKLLFERPAALIHEFGPQLGFDENAQRTLRQDRAFCVTAMEKIDWAKFLGAARVLLALTQPEFLTSLKKAAEAARPEPLAVAGISGDLLAVRETPHGLILIGANGKNSYHVKKPVAFVFDLGGDDDYSGTFAVNDGARHPMSIWIDAAGNDKYHGGELTTGAGRGGFGILLDLNGDDAYELAPGSGGCGFAGIGILCDVAGKDTYHGSIYTQGAAIAGLGLLLDLAGNDTYKSHGFAVGLGGPGGVGAVIDVAGDDSYQCGHKIGSGYNFSDAPNAKPGDPNFQYDAFGMGTGLGRRVWPPGPASDPFQLAGGIGVVIDITGNDQYDSSNFSQACGYFFGTGLKLDLAGNDTHRAARYGHASGAHYGFGLMADYAGKDQYKSPGPTYLCGCSWDRSVFLCFDAGNDSDRYELMSTSGLARADIGSWGAFADLGGDDVYLFNSPPAGTSRDGLGMFLDAAGQDEYPKLSGLTDPPGNGVRHAKQTGELFLDRK